MRRPRRAARSSEAGFTLVEMLVALTLLALLSVILFGGFHFGMRAWEAGDKQLGQTDETMLVQAFLRRELSQTYAIVPQPGAALAFWGDKDAVVFVAPLPGRSQIGGLYLFRIAVDGTATTPRLVASWRLYRPELSASPNFEPEETIEVLPAISSISFSYYGSPLPGVPARWQDRWQNMPALPQLIRVTTEYPAGGRRRWPDLVVALKLRGLG